MLLDWPHARVLMSNQCRRLVLGVWLATLAAVGPAWAGISAERWSGHGDASRCSGKTPGCDASRVDPLLIATRTTKEVVLPACAGAGKSERGDVVSCRRGDRIELATGDRMPMGRHLDLPAQWCAAEEGCSASLLHGALGRPADLACSCDDGRHKLLHVLAHGLRSPNLDSRGLVATDYCTSGGEQRLWLDFNGDGRGDLLCSQADRLSVLVFDGRHLVSPTTRGNGMLRRGWCRFSGNQLTAADVDGDGLDDLLCVDARGSVQALHSTGSGLADGADAVADSARDGLRRNAGATRSMVASASPVGVADDHRFRDDREASRTSAVTAGVDAPEILAVGLVLVVLLIVQRRRRSRAGPMSRPLIVLVCSLIPAMPGGTTSGLDATGHVDCAADSAANPGSNRLHPALAHAGNAGAGTGSMLPPLHPDR